MMYTLPYVNRKKSYKNWLNYRLYARQIIHQPTNIDLHTSRIMTAMELEEREPLQGALADLFFGCWYDVPYFGERMLEQVKEKLNPDSYASFERCVQGVDYVFGLSLLATRWSVLVSPSMQAYEHQLRVSPDDSKSVANAVVTALLEIIEEEDEGEERDEIIHEIENDFFEHCLACDDRLAFSIAWWELARNNWHLHKAWTECRQKFEEKNTHSTRYHETSISH